MTPAERAEASAILRRDSGALETNSDTTGAFRGAVTSARAFGRDPHVVSDEIAISLDSNRNFCAFSRQQVSASQQPHISERARELLNRNLWGMSEKKFRATLLRLIFSPSTCPLAGTEAIFLLASHFVKFGGYAG